MTNDLRALVAEWAENAKAMDADGWYTAAETWRGAAGQLQAALDAQAGMVMVPRVPTEAMLKAGEAAACKEDLRWNDLNAAEVYAAMLAAAPAGPVEGGE